MKFNWNMAHMPSISIDIIWHYLNYTLAPSWYSSSTLISSFWVCDLMVSKYYFCLCVPILHVSIYGAVHRTCVHKCKMILMLMMMMVVLVVMMVRRMVIIKIFYIWQKFCNFKTLIFSSATFIKVIIQFPCRLLSLGTEKLIIFHLYWTF